MANRQQECTAVSRRNTVPLTATQLPRKYQAESFRIRKSLENRKAEFWQIKQKFPEKVPIIVERFSKERTLPVLEKHKYLVPGDITMFQFLAIIRIRLNVASTQSLYLMVNGRDLMNMSATIAEIWQQNHDDDGFLYMAVAFVFSCITVVLMIISISASTWLHSDGLRQGLWIYCVENNLRNPETLPPTYTDVTYGCHGLVDPPFYITITGILCALSLFLSFIGTIMLSFVLFTERVDKKRLFLAACQIVYIISTFMLIGALLLLPIKFYLELASWKRNHWEFGWAFGVAWGSALFLVATLLLICCKNRPTSKTIKSHETHVEELDVRERLRPSSAHHKAKHNKQPGDLVEGGKQKKPRGNKSRTQKNGGTLNNSTAIYAKASNTG